MADLQSLYDEHKHLPEEAQKQAGKPSAGSMGDEHEKFLETVLKLLKSKAIDPSDPKTFLNGTVYDALAQREKDSIDLSLANLAGMLNHIVEFRLSSETPDSSPQLQTMIEQLWQTKSRIEAKVGDVFKF